MRAIRVNKSYILPTQHRKGISFILLHSNLQNTTENADRVIQFISVLYVMMSVQVSVLIKSLIFYVKGIKFIKAVE